MSTRTMKAIVLEEFGDPDVLKIQEVPLPTPGPGEVRVKIAATALNRADILERMGMYSPPDPQPEYEIPGLEFAGTVDKTGERVTAFEPGDRVMGLLPAGGYAEYAVTPEPLLLPVPEALRLQDAAGIPEVFITAYDALFLQAKGSQGDRVLIHAGGGGVGTAAIQLAKTSHMTIFSTMGSEWKAGKAEELGAGVTINYHKESFRDVIEQHTGGRGVDVILDFVGAPYLDDNIRSAASRGRIVFIGLLGGPTAELNMGLVLRKRLQLIGTVLRGRPVEEKMIVTQSFKQHVLPLFQQGLVTPVIDRRFPLSEAAAAHRHMEANKNFGKIILQTG